MSLRDTVSHIENLLAFQSTKEPFIIGAYGYHHHLNVFMGLFLKQHDYDLIEINCKEYSYSIHQNCEQFITSRVNDALEQAKKMDKPFLLIKNHGILNEPAQETLTALLKDGKGLTIKEELIPDSYGNEVIAKKSFLPAMITTQHSFPSNLVLQFFDQAPHYVEKSWLRYNKILEAQYQVDEKQQQERYYEIEKESVAILLQRQKLIAEKNKLKNQAKTTP